MVAFSCLFSGCSLWLWLLGWKRLQHEPLLDSSEYLRYTQNTLQLTLTVVSFSVQLCIPFFLFRFPNQSETGTWCEPPPPTSFRFRFDQGSFKKPENSFWWTTVPAKWFSSFISSAYWLMGLRALLVSCMPGALKSPLDLQRHLTWDTCCRYDGRSMSLSAVRGW